MKLPIMLKRLLQVTGVLLVLLVVAAFAIPYFFKDKIVAQVKEGINKEVNAKVDFTDVDISLFRHFPNISVKLVGLDVTGVGKFEGTKLLHTEGLDLALNFWNVWGGGNPYEINSIYVDKPLLNVVVLADGKANYDITKPSKSSEPSAFKMSLDHYQINKGTLIYDDHTMDFYMALKGMNHQGSGEMTATVYDLDTDTQVDSLTMSYGNVTYLKNAKTDVKTLLNIDMDKMKFILKKTVAKVNNLDLNMDGWTQLKGNDILMDFNFKAPSNNFKDFLSIIPAAYTANYSDVQANGKFTFDGFVKGTYNDKTYPAFKINTSILNGSFQYPKLPMGATDINTNITVALPSSNYDDLKVDVPKFHMILGKNPFDAVFYLRTPVSDPNVDLKANGILNLADIPKIMPMADIQNLTGVINADIAVKTLMSYIDKKMYDKVDMKGALKVNGMNVQMKGYPPVLVSDLAMNFTPNNVNIGNFTGKLGKSDLQASGVIDNILAFFSTNKTMTGTVNFNSNLFDANEWMPKTAATTTTTAAAVGTKPVDKTERPFDRFNFTINGKIDKLLYEKYDIQNSAAAGNFTPNRFIINNFQTKIGNSDVAGKGDLIGIFDWLFDNGTLGGNLDMKSNLMDLNQFMTETPQPSTPSVQTANTATEPIVVPKNVDVVVNANMNRVLYTNMDMTNVTGKLVVKNQEVKIEDASAGMFGGRTNITGGYNTQDVNKPKFKMALDLKNIDFQQSFTTLNTFQKLAPIGKFLTGKFNTTMTMDGALGKDLMPDFNTLNLAGFIQTIKGFFSGLKPFEEIGNKLNISELKNLDLSDTKNWIEVKNGFVTVREFDKKIKDMTFTIAGSHSLTNDMNYTIKTKIPRKKLESNAIGAAAGTGFNVLVSEAAKYGVNIKNSEFVNVLFSVTGSMLAPKVGMKVMGGDGQTTLEDAAKGAVTAVVAKAKDTVVTRANEELDKAKQKAKDIADKALDSAKNVINAKVEEAKDKAVEKAKTEVGKVLDKEVGDKVGKKAQEEIDKQLEKAGANDKVKKEADKLKDKLDKWDPFGKKKKPAEPKPDTTG
jgi:AsmA-like C-terminal region